jgi:hypothetical protein
LRQSGLLYERRILGATEPISRPALAHPFRTHPRYTYGAAPPNHMFHLKHRLALRSSIGMLALFLAACGGSSSDLEGVRIRVGSTDIVLGPNRLMLAVLDAEDRPLGEADVTLKFFHLDGDDPETVKAETRARFLGRGIPESQALYSARVDLDGTGAWGVEAIIRRGDEGPLTHRFGFRAKTTADVPNIGQPAPSSRNQTLSEAPIEQLTSERPPGDAEFYRLTIADALEQARPFMVVFSTPAFCQTRTCGPQLGAAQSLKERHGDRLNFIHIEVFERPDLLLQGEGQPQTRPTVNEWDLQTEPWVFLIDGRGAIFDRFEGFAPEAEIEESIARLLATG